MTSTKIVTAIWNLACVLAVLLSEALADPAIMGLFPPKYAHLISVAAVALMWIRSHRNLFINPDGTPAVVAYQPPSPGKP